MHANKGLRDWKRASGLKERETRLRMHAKRAWVGLHHHVNAMPCFGITAAVHVLPYGGVRRHHRQLQPHDVVHVHWTQDLQVQHRSGGSQREAEVKASWNGAGHI